MSDSTNVINSLRGGLGKYGRKMFAGFKGDAFQGGGIGSRQVDSGYMIY